LSNNTIDYPVLVTALQTSLPDIAVENVGHDGATGFKLRLPPYTPAEVHPVRSGETFDAEARCFVCLASIAEASSSTGENYCAFLFQVRAMVNHGLLVRVLISFLEQYEYLPIG
jgi:hypothetical protein